MDLYTALMYAALVAAGVAAGFINTIAGGGSLLTLPALMLTGLPADVANGSNRLGIVSQSLSGVVGFDRGGALDRSGIAAVLIPTGIGSLAGAVAAAHVPPVVLEYVLLGTMILIAAVMALRPQAINADAGSKPRWQTHRGRAIGGLFLAGLYGGFVQAGVGFVLLTILGGVLRYDVARANALKLVCTFVFGAVALAVFIVFNQVAWAPAALLAVATFAGSQLGVRFALRVHHGVLRWIILAAVVAMSVAALLQQ